jgi:hypothetical protein
MEREFYIGRPDEMGLSERWTLVDDASGQSVRRERVFLRATLPGLPPFKAPIKLSALATFCLATLILAPRTS